MDKVTTDKARSGIPMTPEEKKDYDKAFTDILESIEYCKKHPIKLKK